MKQNKTKYKYHKVWLANVEIGAEEGSVFNDLIDWDGVTKPTKYIGAYANVLVKADDIYDALKMCELGLAEKKFKVLFINSIENVESAVKNKEYKKKLVERIKWLLKSEYYFVISGKLFCYDKQSK